MTHQGSLKQQCIDEHGLYTWQKKDFTLYIAQGKLDIRSQSDADDDLLSSTASVSLQGARYAKEWSFSSALAGYGFDILWISGKIWSFLVDNEADCNEWVAALNEAIRCCNEEYGQVPTTNKPPTTQQINPKAKVGYETHKEYLNQLNSSNQSFDDTTRNISMSTLQPQLGLSVDITQANMLHSRSLSPSHRQIKEYRYHPQENEESNIDHIGVAMRASRDCYDDLLRVGLATTTASPAPPPPPPTTSYAAHNYSTLLNISEIPRYNQSQLDSGSDNGSVPPPPFINTSVNTTNQPVTTSAKRSMSPSLSSPKAGLRSPSSSTRNNAASSPKATSTNTVTRTASNKSPISSSRQRDALASPKAGARSPTSSRTSSTALSSPKAVSKQPTTNNAAISAKINTNNNNNTAPAPADSNNYNNYTNGSNSLRSSGEYVDQMKSIFAHTKQTLHTAEQQAIYPQQHYYPSNNAAAAYNNNSVPITTTSHYNMPPRNSVANADNISLQIQCAQLEQLLSEEKAANQQMQAEMRQLQQHYNGQVNTLQQHLHEVQVREQDISQKLSEEVQSRVVRKANEHSQFYDLQLQQVKVQHNRELSLLHEELTSERKRHVQQLQDETDRRQAAEDSQRDWKEKYNTAARRLVQLESENASLLQRLEDVDAQGQRSSSRLAQDYQQQISSLQTQLANQQADFDAKLNQQYEQLQHKYSTSLQQMKDVELTLLQQHLQQSHLQSLLQYQKQCEVDIGNVRAEEQKKTILEVEKVRQHFLQREHSLSQDVMELEKLHATRVTQLDDKLVNVQQQLQEAKQRNQDLELQQQRLTQDMNYHHNEAQHSLQSYVLQIDALNREIRTLHETTQAKTQREVQYREDLTSALTELRLLQAEKSELAAQCGADHAQALQWKQVLSEQQQMFNAVQKELQVNKEEGHMLNHENLRLKEEVRSLREALDKAERLVYGVPQHRGASTSNSKVLPASIESSLVSQLHQQLEHHTPKSTTSSNHIHNNTSFSNNVYSTPQHSQGIVDYVQHSYHSSSSSSSKKPSPGVKKAATSHLGGFDPYRLTLSKAAKLPVSQASYNPDQNLMQNLLKSRQVD